MDKRERRHHSQKGLYIYIFIFLTVTGGENPHLNNSIDRVFGSQNHILQFQHIGGKTRERREHQHQDTTIRDMQLAN